ncbi:VapE domain-containing protein [Bernardetia sp. ABR2-2B]|uniref:VapE domain-containing protein n=1 Tax=Bernardetia sp. ABR2-2B TaxID=3127472 RepID=UPI0030CA5F8F
MELNAENTNIVSNNGTNITTQKPQNEVVSNDFKKIFEAQILECIKKGQDIELSKAELIPKFSTINPTTAKNIIERMYKENEVFFHFYSLNKNDQILTYLRHYEKGLRLNLITNEFDNKGRILNDADLNTILIEAQNFGIKKCSSNTFFTILNSNFITKYNPFIDFFEKNKKRKPTGVIKAFSDSIISPIEVSSNGLSNEDYNYRFIKKWLIGLIASVYGGKSNLFLILVGGQGTGKSQFFLRMLPSELKNYLIETKLDNEKESDLAQKMGSALIILDDEMGGKNKSDWKLLKALSDKDTFRVRLPYGRLMQSIKRIASFAGTSNDYELLGDLTGNRRLLPIEVSSIEHKEYNAIDKTDLLMEAYHCFKNGETHELNSEDKELLNRYSYKFQITDSIMEVIEECLELPTEDNKDKIVDMTATELAKFLDFYAPTKIYPTQLGQRLQNFGFCQKHERIGRTTKRFYSVIKKKGD